MQDQYPIQCTASGQYTETWMFPWVQVGVLLPQFLVIGDDAIVDPDETLDQNRAVLRRHAIEVVVQEILVSELLTRVWSTAMITHDTVKGGDELYGLAHGIHRGVGPL